MPVSHLQTEMRNGQQKNAATSFWFPANWLFWTPIMRKPKHAHISCWCEIVARLHVSFPSDTIGLMVVVLQIRSCKRQLILRQVNCARWRRKFTLKSHLAQFTEVRWFCPFCQYPFWGRRQVAVSFQGPGITEAALRKNHFVNQGFTKWFFR